MTANGSRRLPAPLVLAERGSASKLHTRWSKLQELRALGRATADAWLDKSADQFRRSSTLTDDDLPEAVAA